MHFHTGGQGLWYIAEMEQPHEVWFQFKLDIEGTWIMPNFDLSLCGSLSQFCHRFDPWLWVWIQKDALEVPGTCPQCDPGCRKDFNFWYRGKGL